MAHIETFGSTGETLRMSRSPSAAGHSGRRSSVMTSLLHLPTPRPSTSPTPTLPGVQETSGGGVRRRCTPGSPQRRRFVGVRDRLTTHAYLRQLLRMSRTPSETCPSVCRSRASRPSVLRKNRRLQPRCLFAGLRCPSRPVKNKECRDTSPSCSLEVPHCGAVS